MDNPISFGLSRHEAPYSAKGDFKSSQDDILLMYYIYFIYYVMIIYAYYIANFCSGGSKGGAITPSPPLGR